MFSKGNKSVFYRDIIKEVSEESILNYYTGISKIPDITNSPLRQDNNPSFSVFYSGSGRIHFKDFGTNKSYNLVGFLGVLLELKTPGKIISRLLDDLDQIKAINEIIVKDANRTYSYDKKKVVSSIDIQVKVRDWKQYDLNYWNTYGISLEWLKFGNVYPISQIFLDGRRIPADKYAYAYVEFKDNIPTYKIYQPFSKKWKWSNNHNSSVWDLWSQTMRVNSDRLIITSSRKDALTIWANLHIPAVSLQSENTLPKPHIVKQLQDRFKYIYCLYDNDEPGIRASNILCEEYNFIHLEIPKVLESKDPSDLFKHHGKQVFMNILNNLINK